MSLLTGKVGYKEKKWNRHIKALNLYNIFGSKISGQPGRCYRRFRKMVEVRERERGKLYFFGLEKKKCPRLVTCVRPSARQLGN